MSRVIAKPLAGLLAGTIFGLGLSVSQMANPEKVLAFLDILGEWDPSLLFTMGGAVLVTFAGYQWVLRRRPVLEDGFKLPANIQVDRRLLLGALIFGIGWGLAGYCPGPVVTGISSGMAEPIIFIVAMLVGSQFERLWLVRHPTPGS